MTHEVESVVRHVKLQGEPDYLDSVTEEEDSDSMIGLALEQSDELYNQAVAIVCREKKHQQVLFRGIFLLDIIGLQK